VSISQVATVLSHFVSSRWRYCVLGLYSVGLCGAYDMQKLGFDDVQSCDLSWGQVCSLAMSLDDIFFQNEILCIQ
jgi:hypothetical protein